MGRSNFSFQKRQKELARKKKKEDKRQRKLEKKALESGENPEEVPDEPADGEPAGGDPEDDGSAESG